MSVDYRKMVAKQLGLPEPPRGPLSPYFRFIQHHKKEIQKRFPDMSNQGMCPLFSSFSWS